MNPTDLAPRPLREPARGSGGTAARHRSPAHALADNLRALIGFSCYGALALGVILACWLVAIPVRGERRKRACQRVVHWGVAAWEWIMEAIGVFTVDFPDIDAVRSPARHDHRAPRIRA